MNPEIKQKWVAALRSGKYEQGRGALRTDDSYCCLGVLCDLYAETHAAEWLPKECGSNVQYAFDDAGTTGVLPTIVRKWAELPTCTGKEIAINGEVRGLAGHNDDGKTFAVLADAIEAQL